MRVKEIMNEKHPFIHDDELATKARATIRDYALRILPVVNGDKKLLGIVSRGNILTISSSISPIRVKGIMTKPKHVAAKEDEATQTVKEMIRLDEWYVPVTQSKQNKTYQGVLGLENFIQAKLQKDPDKLSKPISEIMSKNVVTCTPEDEVDNVWRLMQNKSLAGLPVVKRSKLVGIITQRDLLKSGSIMPTFESRKGRFRKPPKISAIMQKSVITIKPTAKAKEAAELMISKNIGRIPVKNNKGMLVGIVDREDIAKLLVK